MSARRYALFAALALLIAFVSANVIANSWFRGWRLDLTESRLYSLSEGTRRTLDDLSETVELKLYYSRDAAAVSPQLQAYAARVREMLQTFQARSHGRVRFVEVNVEPFTQQEDQAVELGIEPYRPFQGADPIYFGLTGANAIDDQRIIPLFDPQREAFLEYEITRLIYELENPNPVRVALITSLPIDPAAASDPLAGRAQSVFATEMGRLLNVTKLAPDFTEIPDVDVLAIIHPGQLSPQQLYAIDQFVLRKGRAFVALDPAQFMFGSETGFDPFNPVAPVPPASNLDPLLAQWGIAMAPSVVADFERGLEMPTPDPTTGQVIGVRQPLFFTVPAEATGETDALNREDLMTAWLSRGVNFGLAGGLTYSERPGIQVEPLARTSGATMRMPAAEALMRPSPFDVMRMWNQGSGRIENIALRVSGDFETAFPNGAPAATPAPLAEGETAPPPPPPPTSEPLTRSATPAEIVIVADVDFLANDFYVDPNNQLTAADNASFVLNAIDVLGGSDALVSLRSRADSVRRMDMVDDMETDAQRRIQRRVEELQTEQLETEARLAEARERGRGPGFFAGELGSELTPEENLEIERFMARALEVRGELRSVQRDVRSDIDRVQALVVFINVWLAPLLVAGVGFFLFWRRQRRGSARR